MPSALPTAAPPILRLGAQAVAVLLLVGVVGTGGYFAYRTYAQSAERREALALAEKGDPAAAMPVLQRCLERDPDDPELLWAVVRVKTRAAAPDHDIEPHLDRLAIVSPNDPAVFRARLDLYRRQARKLDALAAAERLLEFDPTDVHLRTEVAGLALAAGRFDDAVRHFRQLLSGPSPQPRHELQTALARAEWELGNTAEAVRLLGEVLAAVPGFSMALILRGMIHTQAGEDEAAIAVLRRVRPGSPGEQEVVLYHLALSLTRLGRTDEAKQAFADLAAVQNATQFLTDARQRPGDVALQVRAAEALLVANRPDDARRVMDETLTRLGPSRTVYETLATCYDRLGRPDLARGVRDKARQLP